MYLNNVDAGVLLAWLSSTLEIGFLISDGPRRWKAMPQFSEPPDFPFYIWHVPSGPLPLLGADRGDAPEYIDSPWNGWFEPQPGADIRLPWLGPAYPGVFTATFCLKSKRTWDGYKSAREPSDAIGLSSFQWIGNRYRIIGSPAKPETERFWKRLRRFVASQSVKIPRVGPLGGPNSEVYAFRSAFEEIQNGRARAANPG